MVLVLALALALGLEAGTASRRKALGRSFHSGCAWRTSPCLQPAGPIVALSASISHALESVLVDSKGQLTLEGEGVVFRAQRFRGLGFREV